MFKALLKNPRFILMLIFVIAILSALADLPSVPISVQYDLSSSPFFRKILGDKVDGKKKQLLLDSYEQAIQGKHLATIVCDVPITLNLEACRISDYNQNGAGELFEELGFKSLIKKLPAAAKAPARQSPHMGLF